ncbi:TobH protein [[Mycobacterium] wendilense]|uniref:TobH protein n=1 Tax=[Mycobacterium] wendilense TaxID=3064284 RepID=A0ABM9MGU0_9MYCO|nr:TobH protein [Mycolicibacterium sp. MU0050]CAJ1584839.1 TobH protein [Mycolicibacterium sp. MU0050]
MNAVRAVVDIDDTQGLIAADRDGLLRAAAMAGAQVRATAAAVDEGALESIRAERPRSVVWVTGRGTAESAGAVLAATLGGSAVEPIVLAAEVPPWVGPLDVLVVAGDDPADPTLVTAAATAVRRGARLVVAAPVEGPLRDASAGRSANLPPRLTVPDEFAFCRYLAAGLAVLAAVDPTLPVDLGALADELDAEALRNSAAREVFTNSAKGLSERMAGRDVALTGDCAATLALARHGAALFLRIAGQPVAAAGLADALAVLRSNVAGGPTGADALFHDEELDGPAPAPLRVFALALTSERPMLAARLGGFPDVDMVGVQDVPDADEATAAGGVDRPEQQLATLAVRLAMAAVYLRLVRG